MRTYKLLAFEKVPLQTKKQHMEISSSFHIFFPPHFNLLFLVLKKISPICFNKGGRIDYIMSWSEIEFTGHVSAISSFFPESIVA